MLPCFSRIESRQVLSEGGLELLVAEIKLLRRGVDALWNSFLEYFNIKFICSRVQIFVTGLRFLATAPFLRKCGLSRSFKCCNLLSIWIAFKPLLTELIIPVREEALKELWLTAWIKLHYVHLVWISTIGHCRNVLVNLSVYIVSFSFIGLSSNPNVHCIKSIKYHHIIIIQIALCKVIDLFHMEVSLTI